MERTGYMTTCIRRPAHGHPDNKQGTQTTRHSDNKQGTQTTSRALRQQGTQTTRHSDSKALRQQAGHSDNKQGTQTTSRALRQQAGEPSQARIPMQQHTFTHGHPRMTGIAHMRALMPTHIRTHKCTLTFMKCTHTLTRCDIHAHKHTKNVHCDTYAHTKTHTHTHQVRTCDGFVQWGQLLDHGLGSHCKQSICTQQHFKQLIDLVLGRTIGGCAQHHILTKVRKATHLGD